MSKMSLGLLIAFEGIDGAGKRTWSRYIISRIRNKRLQAKVLDYPDYKSPWGKIIKKFLYDKIELNSSEQFLTFFTDIYKDQATTKTLISEGTFVVVNRYFASTVAFQCAKGFSYAKALSILEAAEVSIPDVSFFVKVDPRIAIERVSKRRIPDRHERDIRLLEEVNLLYEKLVQHGQLSRKWIVIDSTRSLECIRKEMNEHVNLILESWKHKAKKSRFQR